MPTRSSDRRAAVCLTAILGCLGGCFDSDREAGDRNGPGDRRILAAASVAPTIAELCPDADVEAAASSVLARRAAEGVPASVFVCADPEFLDPLEASGRVVHRAPLARNELLWVAPQGSALTAPPAPGAIGRLALGDPEHVPLGRYARQALQANGSWPQWAPRIVAAADARAALRLVERGEVDAGIVYRTDLRGGNVVELGPVGASALVEIALFDGHGAEGRRLFEKIRSLEAAAALRMAGFDAPVSPAAAPRRSAARSPTAPRGAGDALWLSLLVGLLSTVLALPFAVVLGLWLARTRSRWRLPVEALVLLPMVLPPIVVGYLLLAVFGQRGMIPTGLPFTTAAAVVAAWVMGLPLFVRQARTAFEAIPAGLEQAAATLGAPAGDVLFRVTLPLARRGLIAGAVLCFARSLGEFGATITFAGNVAGETRTLPLAIWGALQRPDGDGEAWTLTWWCVGISVAATLCGEWLVRRGRVGVAS